MENKKICIHCNQEKDIDNFGTYKKRSGEIGYRNVCKQCKLEQDKKGMGTKEYTSRVRTEATTEYKIERNYYDMLNNEELGSLKLLAKNTEGLLKLLDNKVNLYMDDNKANRIKKSITLDKNIHDKLKSYCKKSNLNLSDMINLVLRKGLEFMD